MAATLKWYGDKYKKELHDALMGAVSRGVDSIARDASDNCPEKSGDLKKTIKPRMNTKGKAEGYVFFGSYKPGAPDYAPHAHLIELGTVKMAAQPVLRPALDNNESKIMADITKSGQAVIK